MRPRRLRPTPVQVPERCGDCVRRARRDRRGVSNQRSGRVRHGGHRQVLAEVRERGREVAAAGPSRPEGERLSSRGLAHRPGAGLASQGHSSRVQRAKMRECDSPGEVPVPFRRETRTLRETVMGRAGRWTRRRDSVRRARLRED